MRVLDCAASRRENSTEIDDRKQGSDDFIAWRPRYRCVPHDMYTLSCVCMYIYIFIEERRENRRRRRRSMWHDDDPGRRQRPNGHSRKIKLTAFVNLAVAFGPQNTNDRPSAARDFFFFFLVECSPLADTANCHRRSIAWMPLSN